MLAQQGHWSEALQLASSIPDRSVRSDKQHEVDYLLACCLAQLGRWQEARDAWERVTASSGAGQTELAAIAQWMIGETFFRQQDYQQAIPAYLRVEMLYGFPHWQARALLQAGKCCEQQHDYRSAMQIYTRLLARFGDTPFSQEASQRLRIARASGNTARETRRGRCDEEMARE